MTKNKDKAMTKNEFKQGDKVKLKKYREFTCDGELTYIDTDEIGVIVQVMGDWLNVSFPDMPILEELHWSEVVLAEPQEVKTAFLTELRELLHKYDARIYDEDEYKVIIDLDIHGEKGVRIECMGTDGEVNANNIMDFNKE